MKHVAQRRQITREAVFGAQRIELVYRLSTAHQGRANGIGVRALAAAFGVSERRVRYLVSSARFEGIAIAGMPETGYFIATTPDELAEFAAFHKARALHELGIVSRVTGMALPALLGQMQLSQG